MPWSQLADDLRNAGARRACVCGLALDICVKATVLDATRPVDADSGRKALKEMRRAGVIIETAAGDDDG